MLVNALCGPNSPGPITPPVFALEDLYDKMQAIFHFQILYLLDSQSLQRLLLSIPKELQNLAFSAAPKTRG